MKPVIVGFAVPLVALAFFAAGDPDTSTTTPAANRLSQVSESTCIEPVDAPQPPQLTEDEKVALVEKEHGHPYNQKDYNSARQKLIQAEKYNKERNKQKRCSD